jgi:valyl-tRNA synthetase
VRRQIARSERMLGNEQFVGRAKPDVVQKERDALAAAQATLANLETRRAELGDDKPAR